MIDEKTGLIAGSEELLGHQEKNILDNINHFLSSKIYGPKLNQFSSLKEPFLQQPIHCSGSGFSYSDADLHALMEAIERYSNMTVDKPSSFIYFNGGYRTLL